MNTQKFRVAKALLSAGWSLSDVIIFTGLRFCLDIFDLEQIQTALAIVHQHELDYDRQLSANYWARVWGMANCARRALS